MASSASTLLQTAATQKYFALSERDILCCFLVACQTVPASAQSLLTIAAAQDYFSLSDIELKQCILAALGSSSGSGGQSGAGSPQGVVTAPAGTTYLDTSTNNFWVNSNGTSTGWVELVAS